MRLLPKFKRKSRTPEEKRIRRRKFFKWSLYVILVLTGVTLYLIRDVIEAVRIHDDEYRAARMEGSIVPLSALEARCDCKSVDNAAPIIEAAYQKCKQIEDTRDDKKYDQSDLLYCLRKFANYISNNSYQNSSRELEPKLSLEEVLTTYKPVLSLVEECGNKLCLKLRTKDYKELELVHRIQSLSTFNALLILVANEKLKKGDFVGALDNYNICAKLVSYSRLQPAWVAAPTSATIRGQLLRHFVYVTKTYVSNISFLSQIKQIAESLPDPDWAFCRMDRYNFLMESIHDISASDYPVWINGLIANKYGMRANETRIIQLVREGRRLEIAFNLNPSQALDLLQEVMEENKWGLSYEWWNLGTVLINLMGESSILANKNLLLSALDLLIEKHKIGAFPPSPEDFLRLDPYSGKKLQYSKDRPYRIWSVGGDRINNGGTIPDRYTYSKDIVVNLEN